MENVVTILNHSQSSALASNESRRKVDARVSFCLSKFRLVSTLSEHHGCINRLTWNEDGSLLASCSDDLRVCLWSADTGHLVGALPTSHTNNIFGVRFMPQTDSRVLITGGIDGLVELHCLSEDRTTRTKAEQYCCHLSRVKYVETEPMCPFLFFSSGEDGCVRQYDTRLPRAGCIRSPNEHGMGSMFNSTNCLVSYKPMTKTMSVRINPVDVNLMVVATSDSQVHMYDRRMLGPVSFMEASRVKPVSSFAPAHLLSDSRAYGTFADFSPDGRSILATFHSDHAYIFDIYPKETEKRSRLQPAPLPWRSGESSSGTISSKVENETSATVETAMETVELGKKMLDCGLNVSSYSVLSRAEEITGSLLYACAGQYAREPNDELKAKAEKIVDLHVKNLYYRAVVASQRKFKGDDNAALNDLDRAIKLRPHVKECMLKRAELLVRLQRFEEAVLQLTDLRAQLEEAKAKRVVVTETLPTKKPHIDDVETAPLNAPPIGIPGDDGQVEGGEDLFDLPSIEADMNALLATANEQLKLRQKSLQQHKVREKFRKNPNLLRQDFTSMQYPPFPSSVPATEVSGGERQQHGTDDRNYVAQLTIEGLERHTAASSGAVHGPKRSRGVEQQRDPSGSGPAGSEGGSSETNNIAYLHGASSRVFQDEASSLAEAERQAMADAVGGAPYRSHKRRSIEPSSQSSRVPPATARSSPSNMNSIAPSTSESARSWLQAAYLANHGDTSQTSSSSATATAALQNTVSVPHATTTQSVIVPGSSGSTSSVYSTMAACAMYYDGNSSSFPFMAPTVTQSAASNDGAGTVYTKFTQRFIGSANIATDMKEASFFGPNGEYIVSGSDDGHLFIWDRYTGEVLLCRAADPDLLSCVQPHPTLPLLATAGLDDLVRIWGPAPLRGRLGGSADPFRQYCGTLVAQHHHRRTTSTTNDESSSSGSSGGSSSRIYDEDGRERWSRGGNSSSHWSSENPEEDSNSTNSASENSSEGARQRVGSGGGGDNASDSNESGSCNEEEVPVHFHGVDTRGVHPHTGISTTMAPAADSHSSSQGGSDNSSEDNDATSSSSGDQCEPFDVDRQLTSLGKRKIVALKNERGSKKKIHSMSASTGVNAAGPHHTTTEPSKSGSTVPTQRRGSAPSPSPEGDRGSDSGRSSDHSSSRGSGSGSGSGAESRGGSSSDGGSAHGAKSQDGSDAGSRTSSHNSSNQSSNDSSNDSSNAGSKNSSNTSSNDLSSAPSHGNSSEGHTTREGNNSSSLGSNSHSSSGGSSAGNGSGSGSGSDGQDGSNDGTSSQDGSNNGGSKHRPPLRSTGDNKKNQDHDVTKSPSEGSSGETEATSNDDVGASRGEQRIKPVVSSMNLTITSSGSGADGGSNDDEQRTKQLLSLTAERRRLLDKAMMGYPMGGEEAAVLEKIVMDNQKLMQYGPMPLFYQQVLGPTGWNDVSASAEQQTSEATVAEANNQCAQS